MNNNKIGIIQYGTDVYEAYEEAKGIYETVPDKKLLNERWIVNIDKNALS